MTNSITRGIIIVKNIKVATLNSDVAKLIRADFYGLPVFQAVMKSVIVSPGSRTSRVNIFIVPPLNIILEISYQLLRRGERISVSLAAKMLMIALSYQIFLTLIQGRILHSSWLVSKYGKVLYV